MYARNINIGNLQVYFTGDPGDYIDIRGVKERMRIEKGIVFHSVSMRTKDGKYKC
jgi:hypothetical protein